MSHTVLPPTVLGHTVHHQLSLSTALLSPALYSIIYYFASAAVAVDSSHMTASSSSSWSRFSLPSNFVNGHVSTMWFMVCRWPQSQEGHWARPHLCKLARRGQHHQIPTTIEAYNGALQALPPAPIA